MENLSSTMSSINDNKTRNNRWNDTSCSIMRGLFGHLITLFASGASKPLSTLFQFFSKGNNIQMISREESYILYRIVKMYMHTCWNPEIICNNIKNYIIKFIRREITDPITSPIRDKMYLIKSNQNKTNLEFVNQKLSILEILINIILFDFEHKEKSKLNTILAKRLLEKVRNKDNFVKILDSSETVKNIVNFCNFFSNNDFILDLDKFNILKEDILKMFIKRSAYFKDAKQMCIDESKKVNYKSWVVKGKHTVYNANLKNNYIMKCKKELEDKVNKNSNGKYFTTEKYIQNYNNWEICNKTVLMRIYGDAELHRTPWSVNEDSEHKKNIEIIKEIREGYTTKTKSKSNSDLQILEKNKDIFEDLPCSQKAQKLYNNINNISWNEIVLSKSNIIHNELIKYISYNKEKYENDDKYIQEIILTLLKNWNDPVKGEELATLI